MSPCSAARRCLPRSTILGQLLRDICQTLAKGGAGAPAEHVLQVIDQGRLDVATLLGALLARDQHAVRTGANHLGLAADLLWLVGELAAGPFAYALQQSLTENPRRQADGEALARALSAWRPGYCWACGSWPALAEAHGAERRLRCSFCGAAWRADERCAHYGAADTSVDHVAPDPRRPKHQLELCTACSSYLKIIPAEHLTPFLLLPVEDLATADLDQAASDRGYARPPLPNIGLALA